MPKWKIETALGLNRALMAVGIEKAFTDSADLSNFADGIYISQAAHKALIEVGSYMSAFKLKLYCFRSMKTELLRLQQQPSHLPSDQSSEPKNQSNLLQIILSYLSSQRITIHCSLGFIINLLFHSVICLNSKRMFTVNKLIECLFFIRWGNFC